MFINVDLPAPFSPSSAWISPFLRSKFTWSFARTPGNFFVMPFASSTTFVSSAISCLFLVRHAIRGGRCSAADNTCKDDHGQDVGDQTHHIRLLQECPLCR